MKIEYFDLMISIILPVRNEQNYIQACLDGVFKQEEVPASFEVIVADGMSTDDTREIVKDMQLTHSNLLIIDNPSKIVPTGMNLAMKIARGNIIIRIDGHCEISPNYVANCIEHLLNDKVDGVGGPMYTTGETPISNTIALAMSSTFGVGGSNFRTIKDKSILADTIPFPAYTREIINKVGYYDEELIRNQDDEYNYRIREMGGKLLFASDVQSKYYSRGSLNKLWKQYFQYGYWKVRVLQKHPRQMSLRQFVPPVFVLALIGAGFIGLFYPLARTFLILIIACYLTANLVASVLTALLSGWKHLVLLPVTFAILHLSYGSGFLVGLVKFWNRWGDKKGKVPVFFN